MNIIIILYFFSAFIVLSTLITLIFYHICHIIVTYTPLLTGVTLALDQLFLEKPIFSKKTNDILMLICLIVLAIMAFQFYWRCMPDL